MAVVVLLVTQVVPRRLAHRQLHLRSHSLLLLLSSYPHPQPRFLLDQWQSSDQRTQVQLAERPLKVERFRRGVDEEEEEAT
jgi:hypothetical protein